MHVPVVAEVMVGVVFGECYVEASLSASVAPLLDYCLRLEAVLSVVSYAFDSVNFYSS